jgi:hypothetical protein
MYQKYPIEDFNRQKIIAIRNYHYKFVVHTKDEEWNLKKQSQFSIRIVYAYEKISNISNFHWNSI